MKFLFGLIGLTVGTIFYGYTLSVLWQWFVVPTFDLPELRLPVALGIALVVKYLTIDVGLKREHDVEWWEPIMVSFLLSGIALLYGWIVQLFL